MIVLAILLAANAAYGGDAQKCRIFGGELVPTEQVAREVAAAIIRGRQGAQPGFEYQLSVDPVGKEAWQVVATIPDKVEKDGSVTHTDGGGMVMRIDRCNGAISNLQFTI